ncbi:MAG: hypothetical protein QG567_197 [Campylobacterota bacterium]|nr:hypothetical protein [Campylobacterota bacterium]
MGKFAVIFMFFISLLNAKEYLSYSVGYLIESSKLEHPLIDHNPSVENYAYQFNSVYLTQNYVILSELKYYPHQNFAKGFQQDGYRFESTLENISAYAQAGLKKYVVPYTYFIPTLGLRYAINDSTYKISAQNYKKSSHKEEFDMPLDINFGYSLTPTSDILFGFNIDEDLTDLKTHDYQEYMLKYYVSFKNNITLNCFYNKISKYNPDNAKQTTDQYAFTLGLRF